MGSVGELIMSFGTVMRFHLGDTFMSRALNGSLISLLRLRTWEI